MSNMTKEVLHQLHGSKLLVLVVTGMLTVITMQPTLVNAVDFLGFDNPDDCSGSGYIYRGIGPRMCAAMAASSVLIRKLPNCTVGYMYSNGGCSSAVFSGNGPIASWCVPGHSFTGAAWFNIYGCSRAGRLQPGAKASRGEYDRCCTSNSAQIPNAGVHYTEDLSKGSWVLKTPNATDVLAWLRGVDEAEKVEWLKAHGAYHAAGGDQVTVV